MNKAKTVLTVSIAFKISFWESIKLRIAGRNADALCRLIFERIEKPLPSEPIEQGSALKICDDVCVHLDNIGGCCKTVGHTPCTCRYQHKLLNARAK